MTPHVQVFLWIAILLVIAYLTWFLTRILWRMPLSRGEGHFLGVAVRPGFYEGQGAPWLRQYRALMLAQHLIVVAGLLLMALWGRWGLLPLWAVAAVAIFTLTFVSFVARTRRKYGEAPQSTRVALPLEPRRISAYISWPAEAVMLLSVAACWVAFMQAENADPPWRLLAGFTYVAAGLLPAKIGLIRNGVPLPAERAAEHSRQLDAHRRYLLFVIDCVRWLLAAGLGVVALRHVQPALARSLWFFWASGGTVLLTWAVLVMIIRRRGARLDATAADLPAPSAWPRSVPGRNWLRDCSLRWTAAWLAGFAAVLVVVPR